MGKWSLLLTDYYKNYAPYTGAAHSIPDKNWNG